MLIHTRYLSEAWTVDENTANLVPEFRAVLQDAKLGVKALAFIALTKDPTSFLAEIYEEEDVRAKQAHQSVYEGKGDLKALQKNKIVITAMDLYESLCSTPAIKLRNQYRESVTAAAKFVHDKKDSITLENFANYVGALQKIPSFIEQYDQMGKHDDQDIENAKKIIRGERNLTYREQKLQKNKKGGGKK